MSHRDERQLLRTWFGGTTLSSSPYAQHISLVRLQLMRRSLLLQHLAWCAWPLHSMHITGGPHNPSTAPAESDSLYHLEEGSGRPPAVYEVDGGALLVQLLLRRVGSTPSPTYLSRELNTFQ